MYLRTIVCELEKVLNGLAKAGCDQSVDSRGYY